eukprot:179759_1
MASTKQESKEKSNDASHAKAPTPMYKQTNGSFFICPKNGMRVANINGYLYPPFITSRGVNWLRNNWTTDSADIIVTTYPKTGTMWALNIVIEMIKQSFPHQTIYDTIKQAEWIEVVASKKGLDRFEQLSIQHDLTNCPYRIWQTHAFYSYFPCKILNKNTKIIYVTRCPKDVLVSAFHFFRKEPNIRFQGDFDTFFDWFCAGLTPNGNYFDHVMEWYRVRENASKYGVSILWLYYEDMKQDLVKQIKRIAQFIGCHDLLNDEQYQLIADHSSFDAMKNASKSDSVHLGPSFFRKGKTKDWKNYMSAQQVERINTCIATRFHGTDIKYLCQLNDVSDVNISNEVETNVVGNDAIQIIDQLLVLLSHKP